MHEIQKINSDFYALIQYIDNSAPCSKCSFFKCSYPERMECTFPIGVDKKCVVDRGTSKGWNTKEYMLIPIEKYKDYGVV